jgi:hypothetical protein
MPLVTDPNLIDHTPHPMLLSRLNLYGADKDGAAEADPVALLQQVLAALRALRWSYHTKHWMVSGGHFYGDHLLFERLYDGKPSLDDAADSLAEKMVATFGPATVSSRSIWPLSGAFLDRGMAANECPYRQSLAMEGELQSLLSKTYATLKAKRSLSLGMDDLLMSLANKREQVIYLLQQRLGPPPVVVRILS